MSISNEYQNPRAMNLPSLHRLKKSGATRAFGVGLLAGAWLAAEATSAGSFIMGDAVSFSQLSHRYGFLSYTTQGKNLALRTKFDTFTFEGDGRKAKYY